MGKRGHKSKQGTGELYDEPKSKQLLLKLTPTAYQLLRDRAATAEISVQEFVERWVRSWS